MMRAVSFWVVGVLLCNGYGYAEPLNFDQVPYVYAQDRGRFQELWHDAMAGTARIAMLGDSQETSPGGQGVVYIPRFGYELWRYYGNVPETQVVGYGSFGGSGPAEWLLRDSAAAPTPSATRLVPDQILPGIGPRAHSTRNPTENINGQKYGQLTTLLHDAARVHDLTQIPTDRAYLQPGATIRAEVFAATNPSSGDVMFRARPHETTTPSFFSPVTTTGTLGMTLESETFQIQSALTPPLDYNGKTYMSVELHGDNDDKLTDIVGVRFRNTDDPSGVVVQDMAGGGYRVSSFLDKHNDAGEMFAALGFDAAVLHYGANDSGGGLSAASFKTDTQALIARLRGWVGDPNFPVILMGDPYREGLTEPKQWEYDRYAGVQYEIAQADADVMVVNSRRLTEDLGWSASGDPDLYLSDGVHYAGLGARELARVEVAAMLGAVPGDTDLDGTVSVSDLSTFALNFGATPGLGSWRLGDFTGDGEITVADLSLLAANFGSDLGPGSAAPGLSLEAAALIVGIDVSELPEPSVLGVMGVVGWVVMGTRRAFH